MQNLHRGEIHLLDHHVERGAVPGRRVQQQQAGPRQKCEHAVGHGKPADDLGSERFDGGRKKIHRGILTPSTALVPLRALAPSGGRPYSFAVRRRRHTMKTFLIQASALVLCVASASALAAPGTVLRNDKLYSQPSAASRVAANVPKGAIVDILAKQGGWLRVT